MSRPLVLDFDGSVAPLDGADAIALREREEELRFACRLSALRRLREELEPHLAAAPPVVFLGSGDFHHVTYALVERLAQRVQVVVFDNHPDNMRYPFGIHCGSWVAHAARLPFVERVHVAGITSADVEGVHVLENRLRPLRSGKVVYWCVRRDLRALRRAGVRGAHSFQSIAAMLDAMSSELEGPLYLSIDKDVLAHDVVQTNWDQGVMRFEELERAVAMTRGRLIGSDVVGDVSSYRYRGRFKRLLSRLDRQPDIPPQSLGAWQAAQREVNRRLLALLTRGG